MARHQVTEHAQGSPGAVVAYLRVSTDQQEDGQGLDLQRKAIAAYAGLQGLDVAEWLIDVQSGAKEYRDGLDRLRSQVADGSVGTVLVYRFDRLARDVLLSEKLHRELSQRARVVSVTEYMGEGFLGDLMRQILAAFAQYERSVIATRTASGRREAVRKRGTYAGGRGVLGYRPVGRRGQLGNGALQVHEKEAEAVRLIFQLKAGRTYQAVADELNRLGYQTFEGAAFRRQTVQKVLQRETFYRGIGVLTRSIDSDNPAHKAVLA